MTFQGTGVVFATFVSCALAAVLTGSSTTTTLTSTSATAVGPKPKPLTTTVTANGTLLYSDVCPLPEYKEVMPEEFYEKLLNICRTKDMLAIDRFHEQHNLFMQLPDDVLARLPLPHVFRQLPAEWQAMFHAVYYNKTIPFDQKLEDLDRLVASLPEDLLKLLEPRNEKKKTKGIRGGSGGDNDNDNVNGIEFQVTVLLQFNGYFKPEALGSYLNRHQYEQLELIVAEKSLPAATRSYLVGRLLKEAYAEDPEHFPLPMGDDMANSSVPEPIRRAGIHLMFSKNPFEDNEPFEKLIREFGGGKAPSNSVANDAFALPGLERIDGGFRAATALKRMLGMRMQRLQSRQMLWNLKNAASKTQFAALNEFVKHGRFDVHF